MEYLTEAGVLVMDMTDEFKWCVPCRVREDLQIRKYASSEWCFRCEATNILRTYCNFIQKNNKNVIRVVRAKWFGDSYRTDIYMSAPYLPDILPVTRVGPVTIFAVEKSVTSEEHGIGYWVRMRGVLFSLEEYVKPLASAARAQSLTFALVCVLMNYFTSEMEMPRVVDFVRRLLYLNDMREELENRLK